MTYIVIKYIFMIMAAVGSSVGSYLLFRPLWIKLKRDIKQDKKHAEALKSELSRAIAGTKSKGADTRNKWWIAKVWDTVVRDIELMLKSTLPNYNETSVQSYISTNIVGFIIIGLIAYLGSHSLKFSLWVGVGVVAVIYAAFRLKLRTTRIKGGYELASVTGILASKYKYSRSNMRKAMFLAAEEITYLPIRNHFIGILRVAQNYEHASEVKDRIQEFTYSIGTSFARELGAAILKGLVNSENIEYTLTSIDKKIQLNVEMNTSDKDNKGEIMSMGWVHLLFFPLTLGYAVAFMGWDSTIQLQFQTTEGRVLFFTTLAFIIVTIFVGLWFRKPPNDY